VDIAVEESAVFDDDAVGFHVAGDAAGFGDVDAFALERAHDLALNDDFAGVNASADAGIGTDGEFTIGDVNFALEDAVPEEILVTGEFALDLDIGAGTSGRIGGSRDG